METRSCPYHSLCEQTPIWARYPDGRITRSMATIYRVDLPALSPCRPRRFRDLQRVTSPRFPPCPNFIVWPAPGAAPLSFVLSRRECSAPGNQQVIEIPAAGADARDRRAGKFPDVACSRDLRLPVYGIISRQWQQRRRVTTHVPRLLTLRKCPDGAGSEGSCGLPQEDTHP